MLKPRYHNITEAVADFKALLGEMDQSNPKDPTIQDEGCECDGGDQEEVVSREKKDARFAQKLTTTRQTPENRFARGMVGGTTPEQIKRATRIGKDALAYGDHDPLARRSASKLPEAKEPVGVEMLENAPMSRYSSNDSALRSFRVLAGLEEREMLPWNPGLLGTTKYNHTIMEEAGLLEKLMAMPEPASDGDGEPPYSGAERLHQAVLSNHHAKVHALMPDLPREHRHQLLNKMAGEREAVADHLTGAYQKARSSGHHKAAERLKSYVIQHKATADMYRRGKYQRQ